MRAIKTSWKLTYCILLLLAVASSLTSCASLLVSSDKKPPNFAIVRAGSPRTLVENELGKPVSDIRALHGTRADRKVTYRYVIRTSSSPDASFGDSLIDGMTGVKGYEVIVLYDRRGRVMKVNQRGL
jgi:hypothetical protein